MYGRAGCPQPAETILNLDGSKSFINTEIIPIEVMISDGGLRAGRPTVQFQKLQFASLSGDENNKLLQKDLRLSFFCCIL